MAAAPARTPMRFVRVIVTRCVLLDMLIRVRTEAASSDAVNGRRPRVNSR